MLDSELRLFSTIYYLVFPESVHEVLLSALQEIASTDITLHTGIATIVKTIILKPLHRSIPNFKGG